MIYFLNCKKMTAVFLLFCRIKETEKADSAFGRICFSCFYSVILSKKSSNRLVTFTSETPESKSRDTRFS